MKKILFSILTVAIAVILQAQTVYVTPEGAGSMDGSSWSNAIAGNTPAVNGYSKLADTLMHASAGTYFWIKEGTYFPSADNDREKSFELGQNIRLFGGFTGTESDTNQRIIGLHPTILSGDIGVQGDSTDNTKIILKTADAPWENFSFIDGIVFGYACNDQENALAAGIFNSASLRLNACNIKNNSNNGNGSGIYSTGNLRVENCIIEHNTAFIAGGAIYNTGQLTISNSEISHNAAQYYGGGIFNSSSGLCDIKTSSLAFNRANGPFTWQYAGEYGGGGAYNLGVFTIANSKVCNNETQWSGGGLFHPTLVKNSLVANNSMGGTQYYSYRTTTGGGIRIAPGFQGVFNSTIVNNIGEGITSCQVTSTGYLEEVQDTFELHNCIIYGNDKQTSGQFNASYSCIEGGYDRNTSIWVISGPTLCIDSDPDENHNICDYPAFVAPSSGRGHNFDGLNADWSLPGCSVCINMGNNEWPGNVDSLDITGAPRIFNEVVDMGAFELQDGPTNLVDYSSGIVYVTDSSSQGGSGTSWLNALSGNMPSCKYPGFTLLYETIRDSPDLCQVWVEEGVYKPCTDNDRTKSLQIYPGSKLFGGFSGNETEIGQRHIELHPTILSGDIGLLNDSSDNSFHILNSRYVQGLGSDSAIVSGFIFQEAYANGDQDNNKGACLLNDALAKIYIDNSTFLGCRAYSGAAIYNNGTIRLESCTIKGNKSFGAISNSETGLFFGDSLAIENNDITGYSNGIQFLAAGIVNYGLINLKNSSVNNNFGNNWEQAGLYNGGTASLLNCSFSNNDAGAINNSDSIFLINCRIDSTHSSGGAFINTGYADMRNCSMSHNSAGALIPGYFQSGSPGCILNQGTLKIKESILKDNFAAGPGGAIRNSGNLLIDSSLFEQNNSGVIPSFNVGGFFWIILLGSQFSGGAIHNSSGQSVITNSIFCKNMADYGGAVANMSGNVTLLNCKLVNNFSYVGGAALFNHGQMEIRNSLYANNFSDAAKQVGGIIACGKGSKVQFTNCDIVNNTSSKFLVTGVDEYEEYQFDLNFIPDTVLISNSIIWGNDTLVNNPNTSLISADYSCSQQMCEGTGNIQTDPLFFNPTLGNDTSYNALEADWRLSAYSPCINAGADSLCNDSTDIIGNQRKYDRIDMGAYENMGIISVKAFPEGLFNPATGSLSKSRNDSGEQFGGAIADQITFELHQTTAPFNLIGSALPANLLTTGYAHGLATAALPDSFYLVVKHRNSLETWSSIPVTPTNGLVHYDFTQQLNSALGNNLKPIGSFFGLYSGDVNQDGLLDDLDMNQIKNKAAIFGVGYLPEDLNGDGRIDALDFILLDNNSANYINAVSP